MLLPPDLCADAFHRSGQVFHVSHRGARVDVARADGKGAADLGAGRVVVVFGVQPLDDFAVQFVERRLAARLRAQLRRDKRKQQMERVTGESSSRSGDSSASSARRRAKPL
jgi:hypothetical protein